MDGSIIAAIGGPACGAAIAWYLISKTLPEQRKAFTDALAAMRKDNKDLRDTIDKMRDAHVASSKAEADALVLVGTRLTRIESHIVLVSDGRVSAKTGVGLMPKARDRKRKTEEPPE